MVRTQAVFNEQIIYLKRQLFVGRFVALFHSGQGIEHSAAVSECTFIGGRVGECEVPDGRLDFFFEYYLAAFILCRDGRGIFARLCVLFGACSYEERLLKSFLKLRRTAAFAGVGHGNQRVRVFAVVFVAHALDF